MWLKSAARVSAATGTSASVALAAAGVTLALVPVLALARAALFNHKVRTQVLFVGGQ